GSHTGVSVSIPSTRQLETFTMDIATLIRNHENAVAANRDKQETAERELNAIVKGAERDGKRSLSQAESDRTDRLFGQLDEAKRAGRDAQDKLERARQVENEDREFLKRSHERRDSGAPRPHYDEVVRIG